MSTTSVRTDIHALIATLKASPESELANALSLLLHPGKVRLMNQRIQGKAYTSNVIEATVLFADIRGSSEWAKDKHPTLVQQELDKFWNVASVPVYEHGGYIANFAGDGMLAVFTGANHAHDAVCASIAMMKLHRKVPYQYRKYGIGIHTGLITEGCTASEVSPEFTVTGPVINYVCRVQGCTDKWRRHILISDETRRQMGAIKYRENTKHDLRNIGIYMLYEVFISQKV
jgi:class 3 adenylate cyclase